MAAVQVPIHLGRFDLKVPAHSYGNLRAGLCKARTATRVQRPLQRIRSSSSNYACRRQGVSSVDHHFLRTQQDECRALGGSVYTSSSHGLHSVKIAPTTTRKKLIVNCTATERTEEADTDMPLKRVVQRPEKLPESANSLAGATESAVYDLPSHVQAVDMWGYKGSGLRDIEIQSGARCYIDFTFKQVKIYGDAESIGVALRIIDSIVHKLQKGVPRRTGLYPHPREVHHVFSPRFTEMVEFVPSRQIRSGKLLNELRNDPSYRVEPSVEAPPTRRSATGERKASNLEQPRAPASPSPSPSPSLASASASSPPPAAVAPAKGPATLELKRPSADLLQKPSLPLVYPSSPIVPVHADPAKRKHDSNYRKFLLNRLAEVAGETQLQEGLYRYDEVKVRMSLGKELFYNREGETALTGRVVDLTSMLRLQVDAVRSIKSMFSNDLTASVAHTLRQLLTSPLYNFKEVGSDTHLTLYVRDKKDCTGLGMLFRVRDPRSETSQYLELCRMKTYNVRPFYIVYLNPHNQLDFRVRLLAQYYVEEDESATTRDLWAIARNCMWSAKKKAHVQLPHGSSLRMGVQHVRYKEEFSLEGTVALEEEDAEGAQREEGTATNGDDDSSFCESSRGPAALMKVTATISRVEEKTGPHWEVHFTSPSLNSASGNVIQDKKRELAAIARLGESLCRHMDQPALYMSV